MFWIFLMWRIIKNFQYSAFKKDEGHWFPQKKNVLQPFGMKNEAGIIFKDHHYIFFKKS